MCALMAEWQLCVSAWAWSASAAKERLSKARWSCNACTPLQTASQCFLATVRGNPLVLLLSPICIGRGHPECFAVHHPSSRLLFWYPRHRARQHHRNALWILPLMCFLARQA